MINFKENLRHIASFALPRRTDVGGYEKKIGLVNELVKSGVILFINGKDIGQVDVYAKKVQS